MIDIVMNKFTLEFMSDKGYSYSWETRNARLGGLLWSYTTVVAVYCALEAQAAQPLGDATSKNLQYASATYPNLT